MMLATKQKLQSFYLITNDYVHWKMNGMEFFQFKIIYSINWINVCYDQKIQQI